MIEYFEYAIFGTQRVIPVAVILSVLPVSYRLARQPRCLKREFDKLLLAKLSLAAVLVAVKVHCIYAANQAGQATLSIDKVSTLEALFLLWLFYVQHHHVPSPSTTLSMYLALDVVCKTGVLSLQNSERFSSNHYESYIGATLVLKAALLSIHEMSVWGNLKERFKQQWGHDATFGVWSRIFAIPLLSSLLRPRTQPLRMQDMNDVPAPEVLEEKFNEAWAKYRQKHNALLRSCASVLAIPLMWLGIWKAISFAITMLLPFWTEYLVTFAANKTNSGLWHSTIGHSAASMAVGTFTIYTALATSQAADSYFEGQIHAGLRLTLTTATFTKLYTLSEQSISEHARLALISGNIGTITETTGSMITIINKTSQCLVCGIVLWQDLGSIALCQLLISTVAVFTIIPFGRGSAETVRDFDQKQDARASAARSAIQSIQSAKATGTASIQATWLGRLRSREARSQSYQMLSRIPVHLTSTSLHSTLMLFVIAGNFRLEDGTFAVARFMKCLILNAVFLENFVSAFKYQEYFNAWIQSWRKAEQFLQLPSDIARASVGNGPVQHHQKGLSVVQLSKAYINHESGNNNVLVDVSFQLQRGSFTVVVGDVGCGKTTLLLAMLGQATVTSGSLAISANGVNYCGQEIWLQNISIQENIVGEFHFDQEWYDEVVDACLLRNDIAQFPGNNQYIVGTKGAKLSRSQQQRLALARAVYARAPLTLLDDVLSAQSFMAAEQLIRNLFSDHGVLRRGGTVFATVKSWRPFADSTSCKFMRIDSMGTVNRASVDTLQAFEPSLNPDPEFTEQLEQDSYMTSPSIMLYRELAAELRYDDPLTPQSKRATISVYLEAVDKRMLAISLLLLTASLTLEHTALLSIRIWFENCFKDGFPVVPCLVLSMLAGPTFCAAIIITRNKVVQPILDRLHTRLVQAIFEAQYSFFTNENTAKAVDMLCDKFRPFNLTSYARHMMIPYSIIDTTFFILAASLPDLKLLILLPLMLISYTCLMEWQYTYRQSLTQVASQADESLKAHFAEKAAGSSHIRALKWERRHLGQTRVYVDQSQKSQHHLATFNRFVSNMSNLLVATWMTYFVAVVLYSDLPPYRLGIGMYALETLQQIMISCVKDWNTFCDDLSTVEEMNRFIASIPQELPGPHKEAPLNWPSKGAVELKKANISYNVDCSNPVLRKVGFEIPGRKETGLFGDSGSGKSSLMLALYQVIHYEGSITIDGVEVRDIPPRKLRQIITVVTGQPVIFSGATIRQNLVPSEIVHGPIEDSPGLLAALDEVLYSLGLQDLVEIAGGIDSPIDDLKLSPEQLLMFGVAQGMMKYFLDRSALVLLDGVLGRVSRRCERMIRIVKNKIFKMFESTVVVMGDTPGVIWKSDKVARVRDGEITQMFRPGELAKT